jgi:hypothetical protein
MQVIAIKGNCTTVADFGGEAALDRAALRRAGEDHQMAGIA